MPCAVAAGKCNLSKRQDGLQVGAGPGRHRPILAAFWPSSSTMSVETANTMRSAIISAVAVLAPESITANWLPPRRPSTSFCRTTLRTMSATRPEGRCRRPR